MAQEALRNAPCLYKVWTYILKYKVQGPFCFFCFFCCLRNSLFLRYAHSDWAEVVRLVSRSLVKLVWAVHQHVDCPLRAESLLSALSIHESWGRKENKLSTFTRRTQTPVYPCSTCSLISLKDLIHLCAGTVPHRLLCTSRLVHFPLCISVRRSVHLSP